MPPADGAGVSQFETAARNLVALRFAAIRASSTSVDGRPSFRWHRHHKPIPKPMNISTLDLVIIVAYLVGITALGIFVGYRKNATSSQLCSGGPLTDLACHGVSLFCANISSIHLVGLAAGG
jgi:hypothetical protein